MQYGRLFLIPSPLGERAVDWVIPNHVKQCIANLTHFVVEHPKNREAFFEADCPATVYSRPHATNSG